MVIAAALTLFMVIGLTIFALLTRNNFNALFGALIVVSVSFLGFGILCIFAFE